MNGPVRRKSLCAAMIMAALFSAACVSPPDVAPLAAAIDAQPGRVAPLLAETPFGREVALAVAASPLVARGEAGLLEAEAALMAERASAFPDLSLSLALPTGGAALVPALTVTQLVFDAGARAARERAAEAGVLGQRADRMDAIAQAALEAVEAWAGVATAEETVEAAEETLTAIEQVTAQIEARSAAGAGSSVDVLTARSRLESERAAVAAARAELVRAQTIFAELFGRAPDDGLGLPPALPALPALVADSSPTLLAAEAARLSAAAELAEARAARVSPLGLAITGQTPGGLGAALRTDEVIPTGGRQSARVDAFEARLQARAADVAATRREIDRRLSVLAAEQRSAQERLAASERAAAANRENAEAAREQFGIARRSLIELLDVEREALSAERLRIQAERDRVLLDYAALAATGDILDLFGLRPTAAASAVLTEADG